MLTAPELLNQTELVRAITLKTMEGLSEETADLIPPGFANSIRWNLGHVLAAQEQMSMHFAGSEARLPERYIRMFGNQTSPLNWREEPPSLAELADELAAQTSWIRETLGPRLHERATKPFIRLGRKMETIGQLLSYSLYHEGVHTGMISAIRRAIRP